ncbi:TPA: TniQ family protein, partial [Pseudomonas aeruginosa]|nr:TniQ family protein [Pseudomonas aeruginosa]
MKPAPRWPLHPAPREAEALSSWLNRVALCYHMEVSELLEHDLGHGQVDDLDTAPPLALLAMLSQRSGIELDRLRCMSFAGWVPWLLDSLDDQIPAALETYAFQLSVLLPRLRRKTRSITSWRAWLPTQPIHRACPL